MMVFEMVMIKDVELDEKKVAVTVD